MKNLIYQVWTGVITSKASYSSELFKIYANRIGAEYRLDINPNIAVKYTGLEIYFESLNPLYDDSFLEYDNVLLVDMDIYPIEDLQDNIFDYLGDADMGMCIEPTIELYQANVRKEKKRNTFEAWTNAINYLYKIEIPKDSNGKFKTYNAGLVLYSNMGLLKARARFLQPKKYLSDLRNENISLWYTGIHGDQGYINAMMVAYTNYIDLDQGWNTIVGYNRQLSGKKSINDPRTEKTKFVHIQIESDFFNLNNQTLYNITNKPESEWNLEK